MIKLFYHITPESYRKIRNTFRYVLGNIHDKFEKQEFELINTKNLPELEQFILHKLSILNEQIEVNFKNYNFHKLYKDLVNFCNLDLSSFYFDIRKDVLYCDSINSLKRKNCIMVLNIILECLLKWFAPIFVFTTDEIHGLIKNSNTSIHEEQFPSLPSQWKNKDIFQKWQKLFEIKQQANVAIEEKEQIKN